VKKLIGALVMVALFSSVAFSQPANDEFAPKSAGPREQLAVTIFAGLGGAVLGLSTLSFYDRPQDHIVNIALGAAVGIIGGTIFSTYQMATKPYATTEDVFVKPWLTAHAKEISSPVFGTNLLTYNF